MEIKLLNKATVYQIKYVLLHKEILFYLDNIKLNIQVDQRSTV